MNTCIFGCLTGFCMQTRVRVTPAERVRTSGWRRRGIDVSRVHHGFRVAGRIIWRMENVRNFYCHWMAHTFNEEGTPWDCYRYARREGCSRGRSQMDCAQESGSWSRFRESRGDSHIRTVWWSVVRGTEEESSDARNRHRGTLGRPIRQRLYLDAGRFRVRLTTRKQHEDYADHQ